MPNRKAPIIEGAISDVENDTLVTVRVVGGRRGDLAGSAGGAGFNGKVDERDRGGRDRGGVEGSRVDLRTCKFKTGGRDNFVGRDESIEIGGRKADGLDVEMESST